MRNFVIATVLMVVASGSYACGWRCTDRDITHRNDNAAVSGAGLAGNKAISLSASRGNGSSYNRATSGSFVGMYGYAVDRAPRPGSNGYQAGIHVVTDTYATAASNNRGQATGLAFGGAVALGGGSVFGAADSHTHEGACRHPRYGTYFGPRSAEANSFGGGMVGAGSASVALTGGPNTRTYADNYAGADAGIDIWGRADTEGERFWATYGDQKYAGSYSDSVRLGSGPALNG